MFCGGMRLDKSYYKRIYGTLA